MNYKQLKKELEKQKAIAFRQTEMREHYESLFSVWVWELHFEKMQWEHYKNLLQEVKEIINDNLSKEIINNWIEKWNLNKLVHAKNIFNLK